MTATRTVPEGGFRFVPGVYRYSAGVAAEPGFALERVRFAEPVPLKRGFARVAELLEAAGRPKAAFAACELRSPAPFTEEGFAAFNRAYGGWRSSRARSRLGQERDLVRDLGRAPPLGVAGPGLRQVQPAVDQGVPPAAAVGQEDPDLTVLDLAQGAAVLPRTPAECRPFLGKPVSSTTRTASSAPRRSTACSRQRSRAAPSSHSTWLSTRCVRQGRASPMPRPAASRSCARPGRAALRGSARPARAARRARTAGRTGPAAPPAPPASRSPPAMPPRPPPSPGGPSLSRRLTKPQL